MRSEGQVVQRQRQQAQMRQVQLARAFRHQHDRAGPVSARRPTSGPAAMRQKQAGGRLDAREKAVGGSWVRFLARVPSGGQTQGGPRRRSAAVESVCGDRVSGQATSLLRVPWPIDPCTVTHAHAQANTCAAPDPATCASTPAGCAACCGIPRVACTRAWLREAVRRQPSSTTRTRGAWRVAPIANAPANSSSLIVAALRRRTNPGRAVEQWSTRCEPGRVV